MRFSGERRRWEEKLCVLEMSLVLKVIRSFFASEKATMRDMTTHLFDVTSQYRKMSE